MKNFMGALVAALSLAILCANPANANGKTVGYFTDGNVGSTGPAAAILANGDTPIHITDITGFNLNSVNILWIDNSNNGGLSTELTNKLPAIKDWVAGGHGCLTVNDRFVAPSLTGYNNPFFIGMPGITAHRDLGANIGVVPPPGNLVVNGPFGSIGDTTLDGGNWSDHGWVDAASLTSPFHSFLDVGGDASKLVAFDYQLDDHGWVYYSTIPLDFYLDGFGDNPPADDIRNVYAKNMLAYVDDRCQGGVVDCGCQPGDLPTVPEPGSLALLGTGGIPLLGFLRRRRLF